MDEINAMFEVGGAGILWLNVYRLHQDGVVKGVSVAPFIFFTIWGIWNPIYYHSLHQPLSAIAAFGTVSANIAWLFLYLKNNSYSWDNRVQRNTTEENMESMEIIIEEKRLTHLLQQMSGVQRKLDKVMENGGFRPRMRPHEERLAAMRRELAEIGLPTRLEDLRRLAGDGEVRVSDGRRFEIRGGQVVCF